ncbi:hypothetical protein SVIOM342S_00403 [Streptomyces violaceorubidus]
MPYFTSASDNRVVRMLYDEKKPAGEQLGAPDTVFRGIPKGVIHNGGRIAFALHALGARARAVTRACRRTRSPSAARSCG